MNRRMFMKAVLKNRTLQETDGAKGQSAIQVKMV